MAFRLLVHGIHKYDLVLLWYKDVFDPQTKALAYGRPRILINDGFGPHESLEVLKFCYENNIILCRLPSHTSHKLQPCDVGVFGPLKTAYREGVENLYRGGANTVGKQHFTLLYSRARDATLTPRTIRSAWAKAGLYPWNPDRVLRDIPRQSVAEALAPESSRMLPEDLPLQTPITTEGFMLLRKLVEQNSIDLDDKSQIRLSKLATERAMTARDLLFKENHDLFQQNNESVNQKSTFSTIVGKGKVMSYEDIVLAQQKKDEKEAAEKLRSGRKRKRASAFPRIADSNFGTRANEIAEARDEIQNLGMANFCSVF